MIKSNECLAKEVILELGLPFHQEYYEIALKAVEKGMSEGINQEFRRILNLMIEIETRDKFEPFINKWIDLKQKLQSQETGLDEKARTNNIGDSISNEMSYNTLKSKSNKRDGSLNQSPDTQSLQIIDNWLKSYPEDVFPKINSYVLDDIKTLIENNFNFSLDKLSAHILRNALIKIKGEIENGKNNI